MLPSLSQDAFARLAALLHHHFHLELHAHKAHLVHSRLGRMVQELGYESYDGWLDFVEGDSTGEALSELVNRLTTNVTWFNREPESFALVRDTLLPEWERKRPGQELHAWVAGCATGEEAWMLAIVLQESLGDGARRAGLLATDISRRALEHARQGIYEGSSLKRLPDDLRDKHFTPAPEGHWRVGDHLRGLVHIHRLNLNQPAFSFNAPMDLIFCRNVMMYFDVGSRQALVRRFHDALRPGGWLVIGQAERLEATQGWASVGRAVYRREDD